jgi:multidrug transporter EmrE-like cation transporter
MALGMGLVTMCSGILSILVMRLGKISVYTIFMMLGGMMLPFFVGLLFLGEVPTPARIVGIVILAVSLFLPFVRFGGKKANAQAPQSPEEAPKPKRTRIIFILFCAAVFLLNGCTSVLNKLHQINQAALDTNNYIIWQDIFSLTFSVLVYGGYLLTAHKKRAAEAVAFEGAALPTDGETAKTPNLRVFFPGLAVIALYAAISGGGGLLLLLSAKDLPASVLYPMVTGGSIVLTSLFGRLFFKEKMDLQLILSLALTVVGTVLFLF